MGSDVAEALHPLENVSGVKVYSSLCQELKKVLHNVTSILPAIESARPGWKSGIKELCLINNTIEKANLLLQHCAESSKLYLAINGDTTLLRCERIRKTLKQSLIQIQSMVPELLAAQIASTIDELRDANFVIDSAEEEAGKVLLKLLQQTDSTSESEYEAFKISALRLKITSSKALLIEKRSVKKLLDKIQDIDPKKKNILTFLLYLLNKYGKKLKHDDCDDKENADEPGKVLISNKDSSSYGSKFEDSMKPNELNGEASHDISCMDAPPEEFICPLSLKMMADPVVIASGQTYERTPIENWFREGNHTCPKTHKALANLSVVPNSCMKDLISNWCRKLYVTIPDPRSEADAASLSTWEASGCDSISSLRNVSARLLDGGMGDYTTQSDNSSASSTFDASYCSDLSQVKGIETVNNFHARKFTWSEDYRICQSFDDFSKDMFVKFFEQLSQLSPEYQRSEIVELKVFLENNEDSFHAMLSNGCTEALISFLENASNLSNVQALEAGAQILLVFLNNNRVQFPSLSDEAFQLLASLLDSNISKEVFVVMLMLCHQRSFLSYIMASGVPPSWIKTLGSEDTESVQISINILCDLSSHSEVRTHIVSSGCIPKLVPLLNDRKLAESCIRILGNLVDIEEAAVLIAETNGCVASIAELLDSGSWEEQEHAVAILYHLCLQSIENCQVVMKEGVVPALVHISINGNRKGQENAKKLLMILRELRTSDSFDTSNSKSLPNLESVQNVADHSTSSRISSKSSSSFFGRTIRRFSKSKT